MPFEVFNVQYTDESLISEKEVLEMDLSFGSLQLIILPESTVNTPKELSRIKRDSINGKRILLINKSSNEINLHNMDGRIIIDRQAYYKGKWVKVDRIKMHRICGNSYLRSRVIKPNESFNFLASCTQGSIKTQLRFVVYIKHRYGRNTPVYSNTFYGNLDRKYVQ